MGKFARGTRPLISLGGIGTVAAALAVAAPLSMPVTPAFAARKSAEAGEVAAFYRARGGASLWFSPRSGNAVQQLIQQLGTAQADNLDPRRYNVRGLQRAVQNAMQRRDPGSVQRADMMLSQALVTYVRDLKRDPRVGIVYVDPELKPAPPSVRGILTAAASAPSTGQYVQEMGWMNPIYAKLRQALASRMYRSEAERRLLAINLERARALPSGQGKYAIVNAPAARLYMYENGQVVDSMRVVAGRPDPVAQTPMMNAFIRFAVLNPYWNSPPDVTAKNLAPNVLKRGPAYLKEKGYEVMSDWSENARVLPASSVDWKSVAAGRTQIRLRQRPGPANSMGEMKFMFPNNQGIWLHDTPVREKIEEAGRLQSAGCVRLEDAPRFARWLFGQSLRPKGARPEQRVALPQPVPVYLTYLTAVPSGSSIVYFDDFYGKDRAAVRVASR